MPPCHPGFALTPPPPSQPLNPLLTTSQGRNSRLMTHTPYRSPAGAVMTNPHCSLHPVCNPEKLAYQSSQSRHCTLVYAPPKVPQLGWRLPCCGLPPCPSFPLHCPPVDLGRARPLRFAACLAWPSHVSLLPQLSSSLERHSKSPRPSASQASHAFAWVGTPAPLGCRPAVGGAGRL